MPPSKGYRLVGFVGVYCQGLAWAGVGWRGLFGSLLWSQQEAGHEIDVHYQKSEITATLIDSPSTPSPSKRLPSKRQKTNEEADGDEEQETEEMSISPETIAAITKGVAD